MIQKAYPLLLRHIAYPAFDALRGRRLCRRMRELEASQWKQPDEIRDLQMRRLRTLLCAARSHVPYYRKLFKQSGIRPEDVHSPADLARIPLLTKTRIRTCFDQLVTEAVPRSRLVPGRTGGATGIPTHFYHNKDALDYIRASVLRNLAWAGLYPGERYVKVSGSHFDHRRAQRVVIRLQQALLRQRHLAATDLSDARLEAALAMLRSYRPKALWGYASAISCLARFAATHGVKLHVDTVITSSDTLFPEQRALIENAFGTSVFDAYGTREMSIAAECDQHAGMHINAESVFLEIVDSEGSPCRLGDTGRIVVTDLHNTAFPFIRYEVGDMGALSPPACPCGRGLPILARLEGRVDDMLTMPDGKRVSPPSFTILFSDVHALEEYQVRQEADGSVRILLVKGAAYREADEIHIRQGMQALLGKDVPWQLVYVSHIERGPSGKRRVVVNEAH